MRVLLMGHPNVGKSVFFNRLTGANIVESNYPGTTVDYTKGYMRQFGVCRINFREMALSGLIPGIKKASW